LGCEHCQKLLFVHPRLLGGRFAHLRSIGISDTLAAQCVTIKGLFYERIRSENCFGKTVDLIQRERETGLNGPEGTKKARQMEAGLLSEV
jgi:hypothetical protein